MSIELNSSPLGKQSSYIDQYDPSLLFPIPRKTKRDEINIPEKIPFFGVDIWNCFEISWLNPKGKPAVALAEVIIPCDSTNIIESKSFKLYLNSFNNYKFNNSEQVKKVMTSDLSAATNSHVTVNITNTQDFCSQKSITHLDGILLDTLDIKCDTYTTNPNLLQVESKSIVSETVFSDLLKSNCLVTGQPDWGSIQISYTGPKIDHTSLLKYIVSFRNHNEFHEQCVERIFMDILTHCQPTSLTVYARYTRRGGLDINPYRTTDRYFKINNIRLCRQ